MSVWRVSVGESHLAKRLSMHSQRTASDLTFVTPLQVNPVLAPAGWFIRSHDYAEGSSGSVHGLGILVEGIRRLVRCVLPLPHMILSIVAHTQAGRFWCRS